jgi:hypothetical protein
MTDASIYSPTQPPTQPPTPLIRDLSQQSWERTGYFKSQIKHWTVGSPCPSASSLVPTYSSLVVVDKRNKLWTILEYDMILRKHMYCGSVAFQ